MYCQTEYWDKVAPKELAGHCQYYYGRRLDFILSNMEDLNKSANILEIGCGIGLFLKEINNEFQGVVIGTDLSKGMLENSVYNSVLLSNAERLPFKDNVFDCIIASDILEHVEDIEAIISQCSKCLKPGTKLIITIPNPILVPFLNLLGRIGITFSNENRLNISYLKNIFEKHGFELVEYKGFNILPRAPRTLIMLAEKIESILPETTKKLFGFSRGFCLVKI